MNGPGPLSHLRVVELSRDTPSAYCGRQFATWGADVVVLEPPGGSPLRRRSPFAPHAPEVSLLWCYLAAGKRVAAIPSAAEFQRLLDGADILVTDWGETALRGLGLPLEVIRRRHPQLHIISITPFGLSGPYAGRRGASLVNQALSGYMAVNGEMGRPPLRAPGHIADYAVGMSAFVGALAAAWAGRDGAAGETVEVSDVEALSTITPFLRVQYDGVDRAREGGPEAGVRLFPCKDGWVSFYAFLTDEIDIVKAVLEIPEGAWPEDLYVGPHLEVVARVNAFLSGYTRQKNAEEIFQGLEARGLVCGKLNSPVALLSHPQLLARDFYDKVIQPGVGEIRIPGPSAKPTAGSTPLVTPAPGCGDAVALEDLGWTPRPPVSSQPEGRLPLSDVRIVDFTQAWIGPFATMLLATLGADVVKIESHRRPDVWRQASANPVAIRDVRADRVNRSHNFNSVNLDKWSLTLDLSEAEGRDLCRRLIANADIVAENYTPRVMGRFGLDFASLREINPDIVMVSACGFGKTGPWSDFKSNGSAIEALGGWDWRHRYEGGDPMLMGFYQPDAICGFHMAALMLLGLFQRRRSGGAECFDISMLELAVSHIGEQILEAQFAPVPPCSANRDPDMVPNNVFPTAGEDRWIAISVVDDVAWAALVGLEGAPPALADAAFKTFAERAANEDRIEALIADWTAGEEGRMLMDRLQAVGVAAGVVVRFVEATQEPYLAGRDWFQPVTHPDLGEHPHNGFPWRFTSCDLKARQASPRLGEHSPMVLRERLGLDEDAIADLTRRNITGAVY